MKFKIIIAVLVVFVAAAAAMAGWLGLFSGGPEQLGDRRTAVIDGVNFVGVSVSDLDASTSLYSTAVGLSSVGGPESLRGSPLIDELSGRNNTQAVTQMAKSVNAQLLFMQFSSSPTITEKASPVPVHGPGIAHVCYQVDEKTQAYQKLLAGGSSHIGDPEMVQLNPKNPVKYAYALDNDGIMFEVEHVDVEALDLPEPPKNQYRIRHVSLATPDMDRLVDFYSVLLEESRPRRLGRLFGFSGEKLDKVSGLPDSKIKMSWFQVRNLELEIIQYVSHPTEAPIEPRSVDALGYNMIVFDVKDIDQARSLFIKAGGKIVNDVTPLFGGDIVFGRDPDGNLIGLQKAASESVVSSKNFSGNGI